MACRSTHRRQSVQRPPDGPEGPSYLGCGRSYEVVLRLMSSLRLAEALFRYLVKSALSVYTLPTLHSDSRLGVQGLGHKQHPGFLSVLVSGTALAAGEDLVIFPAETRG
jgi:hypothetical protein